MNPRFLLYTLAAIVTGWLFGEPAAGAPVLAKGGRGGKPSFSPVNVFTGGTADPIAEAVGLAGDEKGDEAPAAPAAAEPTPEPPAGTILTSAPGEADALGGTPKKKSKQADSGTALTSPLGLGGDEQGKTRKKKLFGA